MSAVEASRPVVSVVVPCHNAATYLPESLGSILGQSAAALEVILVDDGSTDDPGSVVDRLGDARIRFFSIPASGGPSRPRNLGIEQARGDFVFFFDADDVMLPGKIAAQLAAFAAHPELALTFTNFRVIGADGALLNPDFLAGYETFHAVLARGLTAAGGLHRDALFHGLLCASFIGTSGVAVRRSVLAGTGGFDPSLASSEDADLWLRVARGHDCGYVDIVGHCYRRHPGSIMHQVEARHPLARIEVIRRNLPHVTDPETARVVQRRLAENHVALGFIWQRRGDARRARANYREALRLSPSAGALAGYLKCLVGGPLLRRAGGAGS